MLQLESDPEFTQIMERIFSVTGVRTQVELANFLDIRRSSVSDARRRGRIPADWLITLMRVKRVFPEWILTGNGPCFIFTSTARYETGEEFADRQVEDTALRNVSSSALAEELVRRIAVAQGKILFG